jgi:hypothetical protein
MSSAVNKDCDVDPRRPSSTSQSCLPINPYSASHFLPPLPQFPEFVSDDHEAYLVNPSPGANSTIVSYNAGAVKIHNATSSLGRFENKKYFLLL